MARIITLDPGQVLARDVYLGERAEYHFFCHFRDSIAAGWTQEQLRGSAIAHSPNAVHVKVNRWCDLASALLKTTARCRKASKYMKENNVGMEAVYSHVVRKTSSKKPKVKKGARRASAVKYAAQLKTQEQLNSFFKACRTAWEAEHE